jgi:transposase
MRGTEADVIPYSAAFRKRMVSKLVGPGAVSARTLSRETGLCQATLSRWLREASTLKGTMSEDMKKPPFRQIQDWRPEEKLAVVLEAASLSEGELGEFLRSKGLTAAVLDEWKQQALAGLRGTAQISEVQRDSRRLRELERELRRKDKALAEAAALLVLKKKAQEIWGDEDDDTEPKKGD